MWEILSRTGIQPDDPTLLLVVELALVQATVSDFPQRLEAREKTLTNLVTVLDAQTSQVQAAADAVAINTRALSEKLERLVNAQLPKASRRWNFPLHRRLLEWAVAFLVGVLLAPLATSIATEAVCLVHEDTCKEAAAWKNAL